MPRTHHLPDEQGHFSSDTSNDPRIVVDSGDTVVVWTRDVSDNQIGPDSDASVIAGLDWDRVYPLCGPIGIHGAEPRGHARDRGPRHPHPGVGLDGGAARSGSAARRLPGCLPTDLRSLARRCRLYARGIAIPLEPFFGTMGVCPASASAQPVMPPGIFCGNMDTRQLVRGSTLYLPAQVERALFSCGDAHQCPGGGRGFV